MIQQDSNQELIQSLKKRFRLSMNGVVSTDMKLRGAGYALNYGVSTPTLRSIATSLPHSLSLARLLWNDKIRECRILATLIAPHEEFTPHELTTWLQLPLPNELAEQLAHNLLRHLPLATEHAFHLLHTHTDATSLYLAFLTLGKPLPHRPEPTATERETLLLQGSALLNQSSIYLNAVATAWQRCGITPDFLTPLAATDLPAELHDYLRNALL